MKPCPLVLFAACLLGPLSSHAQTEIPAEPVVSDAVKAAPSAEPVIAATPPLSLAEQREVLADYEAQQKQLREQRQAAFARAEKAATPEEKQRILDELAAAQIPRLKELEVTAARVKDAVKEKQDQNRGNGKSNGQTAKP